MGREKLFKRTHRFGSSTHVVLIGICGIHSSDVCFHAVGAWCVGAEHFA